MSFVDNLDLLPLYAPPRWDPAEEFPEGVNLEFVRQLGPQHIAMRVHERGVGETLLWHRHRRRRSGDPRP